MTARSDECAAVYATRTSPLQYGGLHCPACFDIAINSNTLEPNIIDRSGHRHKSIGGATPVVSVVRRMNQQPFPNGCGVLSSFGCEVHGDPADLPGPIHY
jgi:hypothetical protein